jgi:ABC-2 type transport system permease protein
VGIILMLLIPLILTGIIGLTFGSSDDNQRAFRLHIMVWDRDEGIVSRLLTGALGQEQASQYLDVTFVGDEGYGRLQKGDASALLIIPPGFSTAVLRGDTTSLELVKNPAEQFMPVVADNGVRLLGSAINACMDILSDEMKQLHDFGNTDSLPMAEKRLGSITAEISTRMYRIGEWLTPFPITIQTVEPEIEADTSGGMSVFGYVLPGISVMMLLMISQKLMREITEEYDSGILSAVLATPISITEYAIGKCLGLIVVILAGFAILLTIGGFLFGIQWGNPVSVLIVAISFTITATGIMMFITGISRTSRQAEGMGITIILIVSLLGGSMVPIRPTSGILAVISRMTPNRWAIDGFSASMLGAGPFEVLDESLILFGSGIIFLLVGAVLVRRRILQ